MPIRTIGCHPGLLRSCGSASRRRTGRSRNTWGVRSTGERDRADVRGSDTTRGAPRKPTDRGSALRPGDRGPWGSSQPGGGGFEHGVQLRSRDRRDSRTRDHDDRDLLRGGSRSSTSWRRQRNGGRTSVSSERSPGIACWEGRRTFGMGSAPHWPPRSWREPCWPERCSSSPVRWGVCSRTERTPATSRPPFE